MPQLNETQARKKVGNDAENAYYGSGKKTNIKGDALQQKKSK